MNGPCGYERTMAGYWQHGVKPVPVKDKASIDTRCLLQQAASVTSIPAIPKLTTFVRVWSAFGEPIPHHAFNHNTKHEHKTQH